MINVANLPERQRKIWEKFQSLSDTQLESWLLYQNSQSFLDNCHNESRQLQLPDNISPTSDVAMELALLDWLVDIEFDNIDIASNGEIHDRRNSTSVLFSPR
jgi:hypothetical protein